MSYHPIRTGFYQNRLNFFFRVGRRDVRRPPFAPRQNCRTCGHRTKREASRAPVHRRRPAFVRHYASLPCHRVPCPRFAATQIKQTEMSRKAREVAHRDHRSRQVAPADDACGAGGRSVRFHLPSIVHPTPALRPRHMLPFFSPHRLDLVGIFRFQQTPDQYMKVKPHSGTR